MAKVFRRKNKVTNKDLNELIEDLFAEPTEEDKKRIEERLKGRKERVRKDVTKESEEIQKYRKSIEKAITKIRKLEQLKKEEEKKIKEKNIENITVLSEKEVDFLNQRLINLDGSLNAIIILGENKPSIYNVIYEQLTERIQFYNNGMEALKKELEEMNERNIGKPKKEMEPTIVLEKLIKENTERLNKIKYRTDNYSGILRMEIKHGFKGLRKIVRSQKRVQEIIGKIKRNEKYIEKIQDKIDFINLGISEEMKIFQEQIEIFEDEIEIIDKDIMNITNGENNEFLYIDIFEDTEEINQIIENIDELQEELEKKIEEEEYDEESTRDKREIMKEINSNRQAIINIYETMINDIEIEIKQEKNDKRKRKMQEEKEAIKRKIKQQEIWAYMNDIQNLEEELKIEQIELKKKKEELRKARKEEKKQIKNGPFTSDILNKLFVNREKAIRINEDKITNLEKEIETIKRKMRRNQFEIEKPKEKNINKLFEEKQKKLNEIDEIKKQMNDIKLKVNIEATNKIYQIEEEILKYNKLNKLRNKLQEIIDLTEVKGKGAARKTLKKEAKELTIDTGLLLRFRKEDDPDEQIGYPERIDIINEIIDIMQNGIIKDGKIIREPMPFNLDEVQLKVDIISALMDIITATNEINEIKAEEYDEQEYKDMIKTIQYRRYKIMEEIIIMNEKLADIYTEKPKNKSELIIQISEMIQKLKKMNKNNEKATISGIKKLINSIKIEIPKSIENLFEVSRRELTKTLSSSVFNPLQKKINQLELVLESNPDEQTTQLVISEIKELLDKQNQLQSITKDRKRLVGAKVSVTTPFQDIQNTNTLADIMKTESLKELAERIKKIDKTLETEMYTENIKKLQEEKIKLINKYNEIKNIKLKQETITDEKMKTIEEKINKEIKDVEIEIINLGKREKYIIENYFSKMKGTKMIDIYNKLNKKIEELNKYKREYKKVPKDKIKQMKKLINEIDNLREKYKKYEEKVKKMTEITNKIQQSGDPREIKKLQNSSEYKKIKEEVGDIIQLDLLNNEINWIHRRVPELQKIKIEMQNKIKSYKLMNLKNRFVGRVISVTVSGVEVEREIDSKVVLVDPQYVSVISTPKEEKEKRQEKDIRIIEAEGEEYNETEKDIMEIDQLISEAFEELDIETNKINTTNSKLLRVIRSVMEKLEEARISDLLYTNSEAGKKMLKVKTKPDTFTMNKIRDILIYTNVMEDIGITMETIDENINTVNALIVAIHNIIFKDITDIVTRYNIVEEFEDLSVEDFIHNFENLLRDDYSIGKTSEKKEKIRRTTYTKSDISFDKIYLQTIVSMIKSKIIKKEDIKEPSYQEKQRILNEIRDILLKRSVTKRSLIDPDVFLQKTKEEMNEQDTKILENIKKIFKKYNITNNFKILSNNTNIINSIVNIISELTDTTKRTLPITKKVKFTYKPTEITNIKTNEELRKTREEIEFDKLANLIKEYRRIKKNEPELLNTLKKIKTSKMYKKIEELTEKAIAMERKLVLHKKSKEIVRQLNKEVPTKRYQSNTGPNKFEKEVKLNEDVEKLYKQINIIEQMIRKKYGSPDLTLRKLKNLEKSITNNILKRKYPKLTYNELKEKERTFDINKELSSIDKELKARGIIINKETTNEQINALFDSDSENEEEASTIPKEPEVPKLEQVQKVKRKRRRLIIDEDED